MTNDFLRRLRSNQPHIAVLGDCLIDEYHFVRVERISPEFPMPIMNSVCKDPMYRPGGAANVCYQLQHFPCRVTLSAFVDKLANEICSWSGIDTSLSVTISDIQSGATVPVKARYMDCCVQVNRKDTESLNYGLSHHKYEQCQHQARIKLASIKPKVAIFSDYGKGFFSDPSYWLQLLSDTITIVDPKNRPLKEWRGCTVIKPNATEARALTGEQDREKQCKKIQNDTHCRGVIVTNEGNGYYGVWDNISFEFMERADDSFQIKSRVGAGDCFVAILALGLSQGLSLPEAGDVAYRAGKTYVQGMYNRPIVPAELATGPVAPEDLANRDFTLAWTNGCFDLLHAGHLRTLEFAKSKAHKLVVGINSDEGVRRLKGSKRPIIPLEQRVEMLQSLKPVDFVIVFDEDTPENAIRRCRPNVLVKGADYPPDQIVGRNLVPETYVAPFIEGLSTSRIIERLQS